MVINRIQKSFGDTNIKVRIVEMMMMMMTKLMMMMIIIIIIKVA